LMWKGKSCRCILSSRNLNLARPRESRVKWIHRDIKFPSNDEDATIASMHDRLQPQLDGICMNVSWLRGFSVFIYWLGIRRCTLTLLVGGWLLLLLGNQVFRTWCKCTTQMKCISS
jgi:hypothetical protein